MSDALKDLDFSVLQQCMHCGMCLPTCPTYASTLRERHSPRGRIALLRAVAKGDLEVNRTVAEEMNYCLGCLACTSACPAGVDYATMFETARAEAESRRVLATPARDFWRALTLGGLFLHPRLLRLAGRGMRLAQRAGLDRLAQSSGLLRLLPEKLRRLVPMAPRMSPRFSDQLIAPIERPANGPPRRRVALLSGCIQSLAFAEINRATADVLLANGCEVLTPRLQPCCGSLHMHNGEPALARRLARQMLDQFDLAEIDAVITNAGGCGSHLKHFGRLLAGDPACAANARLWDRKVKDVHEFLVEIGFRHPRPPAAAPAPVRVTYHESCHLCHGQGIRAAPREILRAIPGIELVELAESDWCCGSAGVYSITQPGESRRLLERKLGHIRATGATVVATSNPGCHLQIAQGLAGSGVAVEQPVVLLARAYATERERS